MATAEKLTTTVSTKGQVILPIAIRRVLRWKPGTRLVVERTRDGVVLKPVRPFAETRPDEVFGSLGYDGGPKSLDDMKTGVLNEAKRRHARG